MMIKVLSDQKRESVVPRRRGGGEGAGGNLFEAEEMRHRDTNLNRGWLAIYLCQK